jgi:hypothetical protein
MTRASALFWCAVVSSCAASPEAGAGAGPMRPRPVDTELMSAEGLLLEDDAAFRAWVEARVMRARAGGAERVRVPLVAAPPFSERGAAFGLGVSYPFSEARAVAVVDLTSVGIQPGPGGWLGWVEGRFTGELDDGGRAVLEVRARAPRAADEPAVFRFVE